VSLYGKVIQQVRGLQQAWGEAGGLRQLQGKAWPAGRAVVLRHDTALELGAPGQPSCLLLAWSDRPGTVIPGRVQLQGPDLPELGQPAAPLAVVLLAEGEQPEKYEAHTTLRDALLGLSPRGVMVRHLPSQRGIWLRVGQAALEDGFDAAALGGALISAAEDRPGVRAAEVLLVTGGVAEVEALMPEADRTRALAEALFRMEHGGMEMACESCDFEALCDAEEELRAAHQRLTDPRG
jgi:hypothetical protein